MTNQLEYHPLKITVTFIIKNTRFPANEHQYKAAVGAMEFYKNGGSTVFKYDDCGRIFQLVQNVKNNTVINYTLIREDGTFAFIEVSFIKTFKKTAICDMAIDYNGGVVNIPNGTSYYTNEKCVPLIGWHGSYNPPCDMGGNSMIGEFIDESNS
jgi:hypothetical protein